MLKELHKVDIPRYLDVLKATYGNDLGEVYKKLQEEAVSVLHTILDDNETLRIELIALATKNKVAAYKGGRRIAPEDRDKADVSFIQVACSRFPTKVGYGKLFMNINMQAYLQKTWPLLYIVFAQYELGNTTPVLSGELSKQDWAAACEVPETIMYRYLCHFQQIKDFHSMNALIQSLSLRPEGATSRVETLDATGKTLGFE